MTEEELRKVNIRIETERSLSADLVKKWLTLKKLSYAWLSQAVGVSESTIKNWLSTTQIIPEHRQDVIREIVRRKNFSDNIFMENKFVPQTSGGDSDDTSDYREKRLEVPKDPNKDVVYYLPRQLYDMLNMIGRTQRKSVQQLTNEILYKWVAKAYPEAAIAAERKQNKHTFRRDFELQIIELRRETTHLEQEIRILYENRKRYEQKVRFYDKIIAELKAVSQKFKISDMYEGIIRQPLEAYETAKAFLLETSRKIDVYKRRMTDLEKEEFDLRRKLSELEQMD